MNIEVAETLTTVARTDIARQHLDAAEAWLRRLVHYQLSQIDNLTYLTDGEILKKEERAKLKAKIASAPEKYQREIDATTFDQLLRVICQAERWRDYFSAPLGAVYPLGLEECRIFLGRLIDIRNDLQHGRVCSVRQLEQAICYTNDLSDPLKKFFREQTMSRDYDVPLFVRYTDNRGNQSTLEGVSLTMANRNIDWRRHGNGDLYPGDTLVAEVEVDPTFAPATYVVSWHSHSYTLHGEGTRALVHIENQHVGEQFELWFQLKTNLDWHRYAGIDDRLTLLFRVLPPLG